MNSQVNKILKRLKTRLTNSGDETKVDRLAKYFKHKVLNRGNNNPTIHNTYKELKNEKDYSQLNSEDKFNLGLELIKSSYMDDKIVGCSVISEVHRKIGRDHIHMLVEIVRDNNCNEWGTCDTLASKVFRPYSLLNKDNTIYVS
jgi:3-methyladenine DNA glycosylase AlkD